MSASAACIRWPCVQVFADRQPVEWGLTEVVEKSLRPGLSIETWRSRQHPPIRQCMHIEDQLRCNSSFASA
eukprot:6156104-Amphidinium_carterae.1